MEKQLLVNEYFYSLQGEGGNQGRAAIFIRLSKCNLACPFCDTEFETGEKYTLSELYEKISQYPSRLIIWTGGEPTLQLTPEVTSYFHERGYYQAIETNGTRPVPRGIDYITCSPKVEAMPLLTKNFPDGVDEFRFPLGVDTPAPPSIESLPKAKNYFVSPIFVGEDKMDLDRRALERCIQWVQDHPEWRLSLQMHKLIDIR